MYSPYFPLHGYNQQPLMAPANFPRYGYDQQPPVANANFPVYGFNQQPPVANANFPVYGFNQQPPVANANFPVYGFNQQPPEAPANFPFYGMNPYPMYNPYWGHGFFLQQPTFPAGWPNMRAAQTPAPRRPRRQRIRAEAATPVLFACSADGCGDTFGSSQQLKAHKEQHCKRELNERVTKARMHFRTIGSHQRFYTSEHWENLKKICILLGAVSEAEANRQRMPSDGITQESATETQWLGDKGEVIAKQQSKDGMRLFFCAKGHCMHVTETEQELVSHQKNAH